MYVSTLEGTRTNGAGSVATLGEGSTATTAGTPDDAAVVAVVDDAGQEPPGRP
ncbi:hypothetical protein [Streptomyces clavifer]|uniref:hypothetical protein n=1 Tax=Streptomyces clavifer TaxID=68188 RepID=UPI0033B32745